MDRDEMIEILEGVARHESNQSARIQAIRLLREMAAEEDDVRPVSAFEDLCRIDRN
jgi:hypothetical protein